MMRKDSENTALATHISHIAHTAKMSFEKKKWKKGEKLRKESTTSQLRLKAKPHDEITPTENHAQQTLG